MLDVVKAIAAEVDCSPAQVALAWAMAKPGVTSPLIGARTVEQLTSNLAAASLTLDHEQMAWLDEVSAPPLGFSAGLASFAIRRMVFGGRDVRGWGD